MSRDLVRWNAPEWIPDSIRAPNLKAKLANTPTLIEFRDQRTVLSTGRCRRLSTGCLPGSANRLCQTVPWIPDEVLGFNKPWI